MKKKKKPELLVTFSIWKAITGKDHNAIPNSIQQKRVFHASVVNMILVHLNISKCSFWHRHHSCPVLSRKMSILSLMEKWFIYDFFTRLDFFRTMDFPFKWILWCNSRYLKNLHFKLRKSLTIYRKLRNDLPIRRKGEKSFAS